MPRSFSFCRRDWISILFLTVFAVLVSLPGLRSTNIDDLDSAHHLMDGYFFHDAFRDHPTSAGYVIQYYKQYPALGFGYWPPLFPLSLGLLTSVAGDHVLVGRACMLLWGVAFTLAFYFLLRRQLPSWLSFCAAISCITVPGMIWSFNEIMLELPTLAVMCIALLLYLHARDQVNEPTSTLRGLGTGVALAAVIYAKQPAFFLYLAILFDVLATPALLRKKETWISVATLVFLAIPLAIFTLKFGHANIAQSVGSGTDTIMAGYKTSPRWSLATWSYYPGIAGSSLNFVVIVLGIGGLVWSFLSRSFREANRLWLGWFAFFYLTFSYYDNRQPRHATFWWPAWIALAAAALYVIINRSRRTVALLLPSIFLLPVPFQLVQARQKDFSDYHDQMPIVKQLFREGDPGNILLLGPDKQTWVPFIREFDSAREVHVLRGETLMEAGMPLQDILQKFRIGTVLMEVPSDPAGEIQELQSEMTTLDNMPNLVRKDDAHFARRGRDVRVLQYRYTGIKDEVMSDVPLSHHTIE
jgi:4-amino-4-deoxy-L-arabinose transferase-like glycosyltransferase